MWAVAASVAPGRIAADTKSDLYVDPWGFLASALHLWDPQVSWGGLQNQAYGYLFPMGPFFGLGSELLPMWVVQRLWWATLLTAGFAGMLGLLRALQVGGPRVRVIAALAYALAPRVVSTIGTVSSEAHPQLLAPLILWPLVLVDRGRLGARKGAALSGLAVLCCGGVNATATAFAVLPAAIWLVTRTRWWRRTVTYWWVACVAAATSWWVVPLLTLGRYSPPFLDWIENAGTVSSQITLLDVLRGTTHWLGHLVTAGGAWWPAGQQIVSARSSILFTTAVMTLGLVGLALRGLPHRTFFLALLATGLLVIAVPHEAPFGSPLTEQVQAALDGPLAPLRNIHKADLLVRLPLAVGLAHLLGRVPEWKSRVAWAREAVVGAAALLVVAAAAPGFSGAIAARGTFTEYAPQWQQLGSWLDQRPGERALIVPASSFGEYVWGRPMDEPLRALTTAAYAVRDAVPLTPAGTIRLLDEVESRLQTGRSLDGAMAMLRQSGVRHLVLRNDLSTGASGQPPVALARSALLNSPGITLTKGFGSTWVDAANERVFPLEVYSLDGVVADELTLWNAADVIGATGAAEDLARLEDAGLGGRPVIFDGDLTSALMPERSVVTDGFRARTRWFGAPRGQDVTSTLTQDAARHAPDYLPWGDVNRRSTMAYDGIRDVSATTSVAQDYRVGDLQPAHRPFAAIDGNPTTSWVVTGDASPELRVEFGRAVQLPSVSILPLTSRDRFGDALGIATRVVVSTDHGSVESRLSTSGERTAISLPSEPTTTLRVRITATTAGSPASTLTGLADVRIPGIEPREVVRTPERAAAGVPADSAILGADLPGRDGCSAVHNEIRCLPGMLLDPESSGALTRDVTGLAAGTSSLRGTLGVDPQAPAASLLDVAGVKVEASSQRGYAPAELPSALIDSDARTAWSPSGSDRSPSVTLTLDEPTRIDALRFQVRGDWARKAAPALTVDVDGTEVTRRLPEHGVVTFPAMTGRRITVTFVNVPGPGRPGLASLELEEIELLGHPFQQPAAEVAACGSGPQVTVDGRTVRTSATATHEGLLGLADITWSACEPVELDSRESHRIEVGVWRGLVPRSAILTRDDGADDSPSGATVSSNRVSPTEVHGAIASGPQRLLVMADNANAGWQARLDGTRLEPQVVDGRRQGFVVPAEASGTLVITFAPDTRYRWGLFVGLLLAGVVFVGALWPERRRGRTEAPSVDPAMPDVRHHDLRVTVGLLIGAAVIAGPAGLAVGLVGVAVTRFSGGRHKWVLTAAALLALSAAVAQAWLAPGAVGGSALEGSLRLLVLGAFVLAMSPPREHPSGEA
ncbi:alpha-(1-_3)-arabinofuranosyltransferase domain-containing protein [Knoellia subterranea]|uniref:alpha-(1->3)-arabinofuranosyltransferase domain-containing protein n=1 Tax=Knoellia subterranea TaxID=184882 RepID=UPI0012EB6DBD|nr:alpha-(1->3)-arabinofuranosyltransferase family protein [Knoellia subterranea]